jgi:hypothetical protein
MSFVKPGITSTVYFKGLESFKQGCESGFISIRIQPLSIRIRIQTKSGSEFKPNQDPNPEPDSNRIRIEKKGWIRIQMNPDPQPWFKFNKGHP